MPFQLGIIDKTVFMIGLAIDICLSLYPSGEQQDQQHDHHKAETATGPISPIDAMPPGRQRADKQQYKQDQQNGSQHNLLHVRIGVTSSRPMLLTFRSILLQLQKPVLVPLVDRFIAVKSLIHEAAL